MKVIIVGTGTAGLTAAIALRRAGHTVHLFEKTSTATAFGAGVVLGNNSAKVLNTFGVNYEKWRINVAKDSKMMNGSTKEHIMTFHSGDYEKLSGARQYYAHRVDLQQALLELATSDEGYGPPVTMTYNANVTGYEPRKGEIILESDEKHSGDLIIAADGVHSLAPAAVLDKDHVPLRNTGTTIVRFMISTDDILSDPVSRDLIQEGQFTFWIHPDRKRYLLQYPVRDNTEQNFGMYSITQTSPDADEQIVRFQCDRASLEKELEGFHSSILALVPKSKDILPVWKLQDRIPLPTWHRERLLLVGDAAHPMLPNQGQGAGMCIEDAGALGEIFRHIANPSIEEISKRLDFLEQVRKGRASVIQLISRVPYYENAVEKMKSELREHLPEARLPGVGGAHDVRKWLFEYDLIDDCTRGMNAFNQGKL